MLLKLRKWLNRYRQLRNKRIREDGYHYAKDKLRDDCSPATVQMLFDASNDLSFNNSHFLSGIKDALYETNHSRCNY